VSEQFENQPIAASNLPRLDDEAFEPVDRRYLRASLAGFGGTALLVIVFGVAAASQAERRLAPAAITVAVLVLLVVAAVLRTLEVRRLAFQVREHDVSKRSGVITHRVASVPFSRVQHVRVRRGAIERALGLATLEISSAGPNITIPGLDEETASRIKQLVTHHAGVEETPPTPTAPPSPPTAPPSPPTAPSSPPAPPAPPPPPAPGFPQEPDQR
jgi:membrane protein YdbS with pleckstrin-like domain